ncbi:MAG: FimB/Mfa2 family fimbrial subunit [Prevotellaceae bacterium]|jgi:hypothetical protein|nr:FimB/Mfa2 family fimbrial subunit [Prevotellaceae bacterium]
MRTTLTQTSIFDVRGRLIAALAFIGLTLYSCSDDPFGRTESLGQTGTRKTVLFTITVPDATQTRALQTSEENDGITETTIQTVDVLQFDHDEETFAHRTLGYGITATGSSRSFQADLVGSEENQTFDLIIVANARAAVEAAAAKWTASTNMQQALDSLRITVPATAKLSTSTAVPALPMFGYVSNTPVQDGISFVKQDGGTDNTIPLIRAVAKIQVVLSTKAATGSGAVDDEYAGSDELNANFTLTDVYLYNQSLSGWVVPKMADWPTDNIATAPYFGGNATTKKADYVTEKNDPIHYAGTSDNVTANSVLRSIYTFEALAGSTAGRDTNVCLVVGGYYGNQQTTKSYYRIDFRQLNAQNEAVYLSLLRNHNYRVRIGSVTGEGYPEPDPAFHGATANMQVNILDWADGAQHDVIFDGVNFLSVNQAEFSLAKTASAATALEIKTDVQTGWTAIVYDDEAGTSQTTSTWLTLSTPTMTTPNDTVSGAATGDQDAAGVNVILNVPENDTGTNRTAYVVVTAGRLRYHVSVTQQSEAPYLRVTRDGPNWLNDTIRIESNIAWRATCKIPTNSRGYSTYERGNFTHITAAGDTVSFIKPGDSITIHDPNSFPSDYKIPIYKDSTFTGSGDMEIPYYFYRQPIGRVELTFTNQNDAPEVTPVVITLHGLPNDLYNANIVYDSFAGIGGTYVGAFWKATQTGERLIQLPSGLGNGKDFAVQVYKYGGYQYDGQYYNIDENPEFQEGDILFDIEHPSFEVFPPAEGSDAETYQLTQTGHTELMGKMIWDPNNNGNYYFRIGLKNKWSEDARYDADTNPARYAVVALSIGDATTATWQTTHIYIRQGHEPDYLYQPTEPAVLNWSTLRSSAVRWSPYNLTSKETPVFNDPNSPLIVYGMKARGGDFVDYPSQVGAFSCWAFDAAGFVDYNNGGAPRFTVGTEYDSMAFVFKTGYTGYTGFGSSGSFNAWVASGDYDHYGGPYPYDTALASPTYWDNLKDRFETCPEGYRRWTHESTSQSLPPNSSGTDLDQFDLNPPPGDIIQSLGHSLYKFGNYADGYFDRHRANEVWGNTSVGSQWGSTKSTGPDQPMAAQGLLLCNSRTNHSLFFPAGGNATPGSIVDSYTINYIGASGYTTDPATVGGKTIRQFIPSTLQYGRGVVAEYGEYTARVGASGYWTQNNQLQIQIGATMGLIRCVKEATAAQ